MCELLCWRSGFGDFVIRERYGQSWIIRIRRVIACGVEWLKEVKLFGIWEGDDLVLIVEMIGGLEVGLGVWGLHFCCRLFSKLFGIQDTM